MEILHFCLSLSFSGLEQYALELATDQKNRGREVGFAVNRGSILERECQKRNIPTIALDSYGRLGLIKVWGKLAAFFHRHRELKVLHLHSTQEVLDVALPLLATGHVKKNGIKVVLQTHLWISHRKKDPYHQLLYSVVDELWCSSETAKKSLARAIPIEPKKIKVVNYGRNVANIENTFLSREQARAELSIPNDAVVFGTVSRIEESKGVRELVEASLTLLQTQPKLHLVIIGGTSPANAEAAHYTEQLQHFCGGLNNDIRARIRFTGMLPDSYRYLKAFDIYVLPSYQETFSLALLDAQLAGLPVVGSASGGTPDVVREGHTGWLFQPRDIPSLREKLREALNHRETWKNFGHEGAQRVRADFDQKNVFEKILAAYESKVGEAHGGKAQN